MKRSLKKLKRISSHYNNIPKYYDYLGKLKSYSCNLWYDNLWAAATNDDAAVRKWQKFAEYLDLKATDRTLEIGCGWGESAKYLKKAYGSDITAVNITEEQITYAKKKNPKKVKFFHKGWEDLDANEEGQFDKIYSDGCLVHQRGLQKMFFERQKELLKPNGKILIKELHINDNRSISLKECKALNKTFYGTGQYRFLEEDVGDLENLGFDVVTHTWPISNYDKTIDEWLKEMDKDKVSMSQINEDQRLLDVATWELNRRLFARDVFRMDIMTCQLQ